MKKKMMVLTGLFMAVVITAYSVSGTYAKYTSAFTGVGKATVAKWAFSVKDANAAGEFEFDLWETLNDTKLSEDGKVVKETDVADGVIAPGVRGKFNIALSNNSEVTATVKIEGSVTTSGNVTYTTDETVTTTDGDGNETTSVVTTPHDAVVPLLFSTLGDDDELIDWTTLDKVLEYINAKNENITAGGNATSPTIHWMWAYSGDDANDTALGKAAASGNVPEVTITLTVTATQVD